MVMILFDGVQSIRVMFSFHLPDNNKLYNHSHSYNHCSFKMATKLTQAEIDQLAKDSDQDNNEVAEEYKQEFEGEVPQEEYPQDEEMNEEIADDSEMNEKYKIEDEPEVQSEIASQKMDEMVSQKMDNSDFKFKKDQDLSEAQSQFIQSSRLNDGALKIKSNIKTPQNSKQALKDKTKINIEKKVSDKVKPKTSIKKQIVKKVQQKPKEQEKKKEKLSESQIARRMKDIEESKKEMQKKKEEKQKKEEEEKRKEYEQAKKIEEEKKEKNKKIFQQQQKAKKKPASAVKLQIDPQQIKIPQKKSDFKYMEMKKQKIQNQKLIQKQIQEQNIQKLKKLNQNNPKELKGQVKKKAILQQRKYQQQLQKKQKKMEEKEEDVLVIKQIKKEIMECKRFNLQKNQQINRAEKNIQQLNKKIKEKEKILYQAQAKEEANKPEVVYDDLSQLSPVQRFVYSFPEFKSVDDIFNMIDSNGDGVLSSAQIHQKLTEFNLDKQIIDRVQEILDENSDGTVSHEQFVFLVELQLKRQKDYKQILGQLSIANPIDMQANIIDMQAKIKYINKQIENHQNNNEDEAYQTKYNKLQKKADKISNRIKKQMADFSKQGEGTDISVNSIANLTNQFIKLRNEKGIKLNFLEKLRKRVKENLAEKNKLLGSRVEQNLRLQEQIYKIKNDIQERELRFLSMKKIEQNKKGYLQRQTVKRKEMEEAYKRTKQYEILIADPSKKAQKNALAEEMKFLAAVLMIQRNYRKRKARRQFDALKQATK